MTSVWLCSSPPSPPDNHSAVKVTAQLTFQAKVVSVSSAVALNATFFPPRFICKSTGGFQYYFYRFNPERNATLFYAKLPCLPPFFFSSFITKTTVDESRLAPWREIARLPWLRVEVLFMSPEMKEDSDCFLTVSFHIRLMRLCWDRKDATDQDCYLKRLSQRTERVHDSNLNMYTGTRW